MTPTAFRTRRTRRRSIRSLAAVLTVIVLALLAAAHPARGDDTTVSSDTLRTGWDSNEPALHPAAADFGQQWDTSVGGEVFAQPIVVTPPGSTSSVVIVATESNTVAGLDPATGHIEWSRSLGKPWPPTALNCGNATQSGVTSTPVYDPGSGYVYVMAKTDDGTDVEHPHWRLHALDPATGAERTGWPVAVGGYPVNDKAHAFNAETAAQRPGLLLLGGVVYAGFASYCDAGPYVGYVAGVSTTTARQTTLWSSEAGSANGESGIWQSGGGLVSDGPNEIIVATGNGTAAPPSPGNQPPNALGEAVIRLHVQDNGQLEATDYFSPVNSTELNTDDTDLGSGGPMAIPGTWDGKRLLVEVGKDGRVFLLDRDDLGGNAQGPDGSDDVLGVTGPFPGVWGHPAYWPGPDGLDNQGGYVYDVENQGYLRAFQLGTTASQQPVLSSIGTSTGTFGYTSGSPVVTSDGTAAGSALVWVIYASGPYGGNGQIRAYDAIPHDGVLKLEYYAPIGSAEKFTVPATDGNRVFVGNRDGHVFGFGTPTAAPVSAAPTGFGNVAVSQGSSRTVQVTATKDVTITGVSTAAPFAVDPPTFPTTLEAGQSLPLDVTFSPTTAGESDGSLEIDTSVGGVAKTVYLDVYGTGTHDGFVANPATLAFGVVPTGAQKTFDVNVVNTGEAAATVASSALTQSAASAPYRVDLPHGTTIPAGGSLAVPITYAPTVTSPSAGDDATLTVTSDAGAEATVASVSITGSSVTGAGLLTLSPGSLSFGKVPVGTSKTRNFVLRNKGNISLTVEKAPNIAGVFTTTAPIPEGLTLPPGEAIRVPITFTPTAAVASVGSYFVNSDDGNGAHYELFTGKGSDPIHAYYHSLGGQHSVLGAAGRAERAVAGGRMRSYAHGSIYWSPATGAHALTGPVLRHYLAIGGPQGYAGFPRTDVRRTSDRHGHYADFAGSGGTAIYAVHHHGTHAVRGAIRARWASLGASRGVLGYPTTDEYVPRKGRARSRFAHGVITYDDATGRTTVSLS